MQFSPDGQWYWDGAQWRPAYSPDRQWRWDGQQWIPAGPPPVQRWRYEPTQWTRRLQIIVVALTAFGILFAFAIFPKVLLPVIQQSMERSLAIQSTDPNVDTGQLRSVMNGMIYVMVGFGAVLGAAIAAIIIIGAVKLWRWVYWYLVVSYLIAVLTIPQNIIYSLGPNPFSLPPSWFLSVSIPVALAEAALGAWMIVLYRRYGTWARRRVPA